MKYASADLYAAYRLYITMPSHVLAFLLLLLSFSGYLLSALAQSNNTISVSERFRCTAATSLPKPGFFDCAVAIYQLPRDAEVRCFLKGIAPPHNPAFPFAELPVNTAHGTCKVNVDLAREKDYEFGTWAEVDRDIGDLSHICRNILADVTGGHLLTGETGRLMVSLLYNRQNNDIIVNNHTVAVAED